MALIKISLTTSNLVLGFGSVGLYTDVVQQDRQGVGMNVNHVEGTSSKGPLSAAEEAGFLASIDRVARVAKQGMSTARTGPAVVHWIHHLHDNVDAVYARHVASGVGVSCQKACSHCCQVRVEALPPEIFKIADHLNQQLARQASPDQARQSLVQALHGHQQAMSQAGRADAAPAVCPFLVNQLCSIYPVRPGVCRKGHSLDVRACEQHASTLPQSLPLLADAEALIQGTSRAYAERGLQSGGHELVAGVLLALQDPSAQPRWLAGEAVFTDN